MLHIVEILEKQLVVGAPLGPWVPQISCVACITPAALHAWRLPPYFLTPQEAEVSDEPQPLYSSRPKPFHTLFATEKTKSDRRSLTERSRNALFLGTFGLFYIYPMSQTTTIEHPAAYITFPPHLIQAPTSRRSYQREPSPGAGKSRSPAPRRFSHSHSRPPAFSGRQSSVSSERSGVRGDSVSDAGSRAPLWRNPDGVADGGMKVEKGVDRCERYPVVSHFLGHRSIPQVPLGFPTTRRSSVLTPWFPALADPRSPPSFCGCHKRWKSSSSHSLRLSCPSSSFPPSLSVSRNTSQTYLSSWARSARAPSSFTRRQKGLFLNPETSSGATSSPRSLASA